MIERRLNPSVYASPNENLNYEPRLIKPGAHSRRVAAALLLAHRNYEL